MDNIENLVASLSGEVIAVKPAPHPAWLGLRWIMIAVAYLAISLAISGTRPDFFDQLQRPWFIAEVTILLGILVSTALSLAVQAFPDMYQKRMLAFAPVWMFAIFVFVLAFAWQADNPPAPLPLHSFQCTLSILLFSLLPVAGVFYAMRRFASTHPQHSAVVAVLFAFSAGALWLRLYEVNDSIIHLIEWHYLPMILVGVLGWKSGKVLLKW